MTRIIVDNVYSKIDGEIPIEVYEACTISYTYFYKTKSKQTRVKERRRIYFNKRDNSFPTGWLFSKIVPIYRKLGVDYEIEDNRFPLESTDNLIGRYPFEERPYQKEAIEEVTTKKHNRGIIAIGTGGGKSFIASKIIEYYSAPTLYLVPSLLLLNQTYKNFCDWFGTNKVGFVGEGEFKPSLITIATEQTIWSRKDTNEVKDLLNSVRVLILDEAHKVQIPSIKNRYLGNTWYLVAMSTPNAIIRIGLTATPGKEDSYSRQLLEAVTGRLIYEKSLSWLMGHGYLSKLNVDIYHIEIPVAFSTWEKAYVENILKNEERNNLIVRLAQELANKDLRVLIIVNRIEEHGKILIDKLGTIAESLYGEDSQQERKEVLDRFINKTTKIVVSTIIREGVDLPDMDAIILASGGKGGEFGRDLIQKLGRVVRKTLNKDTALLVDFIDSDGYIEYIDSRGKAKKKPNILFRHSLQRLNIYKREKEISVNFK